MALPARRLRIVALVAVLITVTSASAGNAEKVTKVAFGKPFAVSAGRSKMLGQLSVRMTAEHLPMQAGPNGVELFPITYYSLEWREGRDTQVMKQLLPQGGAGTRLVQYPLFGRYTFTLARGSNEDEVTLTVFRRTCLLRYTSRNQLMHKSGAIIFDENEDLCCYYSDGPNSCDLAVSRAQSRGGERYCVLYSNQPLPTPPDETCCCRYEHGGALAEECQATCDRLTAHR